MALWSFFSKKKSPQDLLVSGDLSGALKGFKKELKAKNNKDPLLMLKIGSIYQQMEDPVRARMYFMAVGEYYGDKGFLNKAVAAYKKALDITPNDKSILDKLASYNNQVPKYMINTEILERIRFSQSDQEKDESGALSQKPNEGGEYEDLDGTFKFPEMDEEDQPEPIAAAEPQQQQDPPQEPAEEDPTDLVDFGSEPAIELAAPAQEEPPKIAEEEKPTHPPEEAAMAEAEHSEPAANSENPLQFAAPDFDPDASLVLDEDEEDSRDWGQNKFVEKQEEVDDSHQPDIHDLMAHGTPPQDNASNEPSKQVPETPELKPTPEKPKEKAVTAKIISEDEKMVFSSRSTAASSGKPEAIIRRNFSSLDDALEDLFTNGPDEDRDARKEQDQRHFPLFRTMSTKVFVDFVMALENKDFQNGDLIVKQGTTGENMFIIVEGRVDIILTTGDFTSTVASLETGDFFGEAALISGRPRTASVVAKSSTNCLVLSRNHLKELAVNHPSVVEAIRSVYYARMTENESHGE